MGVKFMAKCLGCKEPATAWAFGSYEERANWVGQHRVSTGHSVKQWLQAPESR
jgi:hypothetical protein